MNEAGYQVIYYQIDSKRCRGCQRCVSVCPENAITAKISLRARQLQINPDIFIACGKCADTCPFQTIYKVLEKRQKT